MTTLALTPSERHAAIRCATLGRANMDNARPVRNSTGRASRRAVKVARIAARAVSWKS